MNTVVPLKDSEIAVGIFYIVYSFMGILLHIIEIAACLRLSRQFVGFRFIISQSAADTLSFLEYGVWEAFVVLTKAEITTHSQRIFLHVFTYFVWWAAGYLSVLVAMTRLLSIAAPNWFRSLRSFSCYAICVIIWCIALIQSYVPTLFPWYTITNVDRSDYGITINWRRPTSIETRNFFNFFNKFVLIANIVVYVAIMAALLLQYKQRNKVQVIVATMIDGTPKERGRSAINEIRSSGADDKIHGKVRRTLLISSFVNWIISLVGEALINYASVKQPWQQFYVILVVMTQCWLNSLCRFSISAVLRRAAYAVVSR